jgi:hypothetical protein
LSFLLCAGGFADTLEGLVGAERAGVLRVAGEISRTQTKAPVAALLPQHEAAKKIFSEAAAIAPDIMVESLHLYRKPFSRPLNAGETTALRNGTLAVSTLAGLQYYSESRSTMRTFYETSTVIDGPETKKPLADLVFSPPSASMSFYARQKDLTFGDNVYRYDYHFSDNSITFVQSNLTTMTYVFLPLLGKDRLRSMVSVIDAGDSLLVYTVSMARAALFPGMDKRIGASFSNRTEAVFQWFSAKADNILGIS